jgi:prefoldin subunit 5
MKQSVKTAKQIAATLRGLEDQLKELDQALSELEDHKGTLPYKLIKNAYDDKEKELNKAYNEKYVVYVSVDTF